MRAREFLGDSAFDQSVYEEPNYKTQNKYKFIRLRKKCLIADLTTHLKIVTGLDLNYKAQCLVEAKA